MRMTRFLLPGALALVAALSAPVPAAGLPQRHPMTGPSTPPVIAAAGDIACSSSVASPTACRHAQTSDLLVGRGFDAVLALGDLQYPSGALSDFQAYYQPTWGRVKGITRPVPGNHEYGTTGAAGYFDYFGPSAGERGKGYYSFDLGTWHVIALNSTCWEVGGCHAGSAQEQWLRADLAAHQRVCTLAYWHSPRFTSGSVHGSDSGVGPFWEALYEHGADIVLSAHQHNYERFAPQTPAGLPDDANGIHQFVVGTGGRSLYTFDSPPLQNSIVRNDDTFGVLSISLHPTWFAWEFIPEAGGAFTDSGSAACSGQEGQVQEGSGRLSLHLEVNRRTVQRPGRKVRLTSAVAPCVTPGGSDIVFQRRREGVWRTMATEGADDSCAASIRRRVRRTTRYRALFTGGAAISGVVTVRVRG